MDKIYNWISLIWKKKKKSQRTHMLFSSSSPPKGKVCREKWRGSPIWQMLFLFSNLHLQQVWKTFWYHHGCGWTYMEWNKSVTSLTFYQNPSSKMKIWLQFKKRISTGYLYSLVKAFLSVTLWQQVMCTNPMVRCR